MFLGEGNSSVYLQNVFLGKNNEKQISCCHFSPIMKNKYLVVTLAGAVFIATDKRGYPHNIFLISLQIHMMWVLIRSASPGHF